MEIDGLVQLIEPLDKNIINEAQNRFDNLIKPVGSLAKLEEMTTRYAAMLGSAEKNKMVYPKQNLFLWTADLTKAVEYMTDTLPSKVMAENKGINTQILTVLSESVEEAMLEGALLVKEFINAKEKQIVALGCLDESIGLDIEEYKNGDVVFLAEKIGSPTIAAMSGAILQAAVLKTPVMLDGLATCVAAVIAMKYNSSVKDYVFAGHVSAENNSEELLDLLGLSAPLRLGIKDCRGEGAVLALSLLNAGIKAYTEMETFEEAGVHAEMKEFSQAEALKNANLEGK